MLTIQSDWNVSTPLDPDAGDINNQPVRLISLKKTLVLTLVAFHLLQASWLLEGGVDLLLRRPLAVAAAGEQRCSPHGCGCDESARIRGACCCKPESPRAGAGSPAASLVARSTCRGAADSAPLLTQIPAVPAFPVLELSTSSTDAAPLPPSLPPDAVPARRVHKVPIA